MSTSATVAPDIVFFDDVPLEESAGESAAGDASLVERLRAGDDAAWEEVVRGSAGRMLATARRILRSEDEAADAVQEAFVQAFRSLDGFREGCRLSTWLHRIVVNAALMRVRRACRRREVGLDELLPTFLDDGHHSRPPERWEPIPETALVREETRAQVREQIERLPLSARSVIVLRDIEGLSTEETARLLGISANAVKVRLHRARQALRSLLDPLFGGERN